MNIQCCKCKKVKLDGKWHHVTHELEGMTSHTYCPVCSEEFLIEIFSSHASHSTLQAADRLGRMLAAAS